MGENHPFRSATLLAAAGLLFLSITSCRTERRTGDLHLGTPARHTPYDGKYEKVRKYLKEVYTKIRYVPEPDGIDYWQLPEETEALGTGDCEDMAILLYVKLKNAGLLSTRLCIGKHNASAALMHAWVMWSDGERHYILDPSVSDQPLQTNQAPRGSYIPYYSYDGDDKWVHYPAE